jgi:hypothetical protein
VETVIDILGTLGLHLNKFGEMLSFSPFSLAFKAFGVLCEVRNGAAPRTRDVFLIPQDPVVGLARALRAFGILLADLQQGEGQWGELRAGPEASL